ncbi:pentapeptide repeat-containing protein [Nostoc sp. GT001]|uniref:pentapeptide repeat-containing protein n=1 Tax=Nostoc sp. GT001 TaxID=3056647 RepID=UPI0025AA3C37|nr:pentapeptide repeat-containing protein [Nostoc sp. GT001]MDM9582837.1 pentapeptide repeat-containing protein [Nostoc sp. GT001]
MSASELFTAILQEANFKNVGLNHTDLAGADLSGASLNMANLTDANLAVVKNANIQWSYYVHHYLARCATYS